jgi:hypothetical protein
MDFMKNTTLLTWLYIVLGIAAVALGGYRELVYREKDGQNQKKLQKELQENIKRYQDQQTALLLHRINELVREGKISEKVAQVIVSDAWVSISGDEVTASGGKAVPKSEVK